MFTKKNMTVVSLFDTIEVIEAESQAALNPLTKRDSRTHLKEEKRRRGSLRGLWWPVGPKLAFDQMAARVPVIMDDPLYCLHVIIISNKHKQ
jgi:hypothetical protein